MKGREEFVTADDGARLWTWTIGSGPPLVLNHGGPGYWSQLEPIAEMIADRFTVHLWDQRGAGRSSPVGPFSVAQTVADHDAVRRHFGHDQSIVAGHSWGSMVSLQYALAHPSRTRALVLLSGTGIEWPRWSAATHVEEDGRLSATERERRDSLQATPHRSAEEERELDYLKVIPNVGAPDPERARALARSLVDVRFETNLEANAALNAEVKTWSPDQLAVRCRALTMPALVVHGDRDPRPLAALTTMLDALPNARLEILKGVGHLPWAERPDLLRAALRHFLHAVG